MEVEMENNYQPKRDYIAFIAGSQFKFFQLIVIIFSGTWLISDIVAVKIVSIFGLTFTGSFFIFPITSILNSVIVETYGYKNARQAIWAGLVLNILYVSLVNIVNIIPPSTYWSMNEQFENILVQGTRIVIASLICFFISDFVNSYLMAKMKLKNKGKFILRRIIISNFVSISIDVTLFILMAFYGIIDDDTLISLLSAAYVKRLACQIFLLPFAFWIIKFLKKAEGIDIYDYDTKFNPFNFDNVYYLRDFKKINT